jgi:CHAT domain-containing protein
LSSSSAPAAFAPRSRLYLGAAATETVVKQLPRETGILHVASHGILNTASPLDSALVLAPAAGADDEDNGLLQAWEVFEHVRVDADLVVLSACDTGLGRTFAGEGLLGLTRAFQFAGARAVAATLWTAPDEATASLMDAFYEALRRGHPSDEALALAQRRLLASPATAHPFSWAAFVLDGAAQ